MQKCKYDIWQGILDVRHRAPVVHNITNYVVMNNTANALLALGASPVMAHAKEEVEDMVHIASALVINIGTLSREWIDAMFLAACEAKKINIPVVIDPVGVGATPYRTDTARDLIKDTSPAIIRGNASEIMALLGEKAATKGVDSADSSHEALAAGRELNRLYGSAVCISGEIDYIISKEETAKILNGHALMPWVTGLGCTASALCGAFAAVNSSPVLASIEAMAVMGIAGEIAARDSRGPGSLQINFLDALYRLTKEDVDSLLRLEV